MCTHFTCVLLLYIGKQELCRLWYTVFCHTPLMYCKIWKSVAQYFGYNRAESDGCVEVVTVTRENFVRDKPRLGLTNHVISHFSSLSAKSFGFYRFIQSRLQRQISPDESCRKID